MFTNINTSRKDNRLPRNSELVHVNLTVLQTHFSRKQNFKRKNVIPFFGLFLHVELSRDRLYYNFGNFFYVPISIHKY